MTTADNSTEYKNRRPLVVRLAVWALYGVGFVAVVLVAALLWFVLRDRAAGVRVQQQVAQMQAAGLPYDNASLGEYYVQATDARDAAQWMAVLAVVRSDGFTGATQGIGPWSTDNTSADPLSADAKDLEFLRAWSDFRDEARQLVLRDRKARLPIVFAGTSSDVTMTQDVRQLARLFSLEAQVAIANRDSAACRDAILAIFGCARAVEAQPLMVSQMVSAALEGVASEQLRYALEADVLATDDLKRVQARLDSRPSLATVWKTAIAGERGAMLPMFTGQRRSGPSAKAGDSGAGIPLRSHDALTFLEMTDQALALPTSDLSEFYAGAHQLDETLKRNYASQNWLKRFDTALTTLASPMFSAGSVVVIQREMLARQATLGIGLRLYEDQHGVLPDNLTQLSDLGLDLSKLTPIGDKPFGYRKQESGAVLWGFPVRVRQSTPEEPPPVLAQSPQEKEPLTSLEAEENRRWVWEFPQRQVAPPAASR